MNLDALKTIMRVRNRSGAEIARLAGVSRQAVSLWLNTEAKECSVRSITLRRLADALGVSSDQLIFCDRNLMTQHSSPSLEARYNWDRLFPDINSFAIAIIQEDPRALARLAQTIGLFRAAKIAGKVVWRKFHSFKQEILPQRRSECESVWKIQRDLGLI